MSEHGSLLDRQLQAARVARRLFAASDAAGAFVTTQLVVEHPLLGRRHPDVAIVRSDPPVDGVLRGVPLLVVQLGPAGDAPAWLAAGVAAVWVLLQAEADLHVAGRAPQRLCPPAVLTVPGYPALRLPVAAHGSWGSVR